jgi:hypothetical protein
MSVATEVDVIRQMLEEGQLTRAGEDGHVRELRATCPADGTGAPVHRVARAGRKVVEVVFRCPACGQDFAAAPEAMQLG